MLLYVLIFLGFKTEIPGWCVITQMDAMHNFLELLHVIEYVVFFFFFWVLRLKIQVGLLLLE